MESYQIECDTTTGLELKSEEQELGFTDVASLSEEALIGKMENIALKSCEHQDGVGNGDGDRDNGVNNGDGNGDTGGLLPLRPYAGDCPHYVRTGTCKFGPYCWYNHPIRKTQQVNRDKYSDSDIMGSAECKYFLTPGGCKYGRSCRYNHPGEESENTTPELNFLGLPLRLGVKECTFYMRNGSCRYGSHCIYHHPDPTSVPAKLSPISVNENPGKLPSLHDNFNYNFLHLSGASKLHQVPPSSLFDNVNSYSGTHLSSEWSTKQSECDEYQVSSFQNNYYHSTPIAQVPIQVDEFPERPGQPECDYFMKTGNCKFRLNCRFHHPKIQSLNTESGLRARSVSRQYPISIPEWNLLY